MPKPNQPSKPRSSEDILREMEAMTGDDGKQPSRIETPSGGGLKSFLNFFVKVVPDEGETSAVNSAPSRGSAQPAQTASPGRPRVADLVAGEAAPKFVAPQATAADLSQRPLDEIYREAGLNDSPCSVDELAKLMENPAVANHPLNIKVVAVNLALSAKGVSHEVPIADAVRRDRALDAYQQMLSERARQNEQRNQQKIEQLTRETEEFLKQKQAEIEALRADAIESKRQSDQFSLRREAEERRLAELISPFLEGKENPVTVGN
ncbi:MAG: hypothetical protein KA368_01415 [Acidobacteria bacterium]|nr:hypothetical protein [Acidobacteriota bacterium]